MVLIAHSNIVTVVLLWRHVYNTCSVYAHTFCVHKLLLYLVQTFILFIATTEGKIVIKLWLPVESPWSALDRPFLPTFAQMVLENVSLILYGFRLWLKVHYCSTLLHMNCLCLDITWEGLVLKSSTCHIWNMMYLCWSPFTRKCRYALPHTCLHQDSQCRKNLVGNSPGIYEQGNCKVTSVYTVTLSHSPAGQAITKKLKSSKKVCELIAPVVHSVYSSGACVWAYIPPPASASCCLPVYLS